MWPTKSAGRAARAESRALSPLVQAAMLRASRPGQSRLGPAARRDWGSPRPAPPPASPSAGAARSAPARSLLPPGRAAPPVAEPGPARHRARRAAAAPVAGGIAALLTDLPS